MEIRDPIHGSIRVYEDEQRLIDHPLFQRLRQIKQTGFSDLAFPGATHTRYLHSIGAMHLAEAAFDSIFGDHVFVRADLARAFRQLVRVAALLHDVGHAPLSHCTEFAMPAVGALRIPCMQGVEADPERRATHEDYTIKILTDSDLTRLLQERFPMFTPLHVAALVNPAVPVEDDFFQDGGVGYRTVLSQIISSELDVDRMDYLKRDSYFAGVSYGNYDYSWIGPRLTYHVTQAGEAHLALDPRAIYAFNDFLISRYHMFLMVYFHHKSVLYEEMLKRYFESPDASYAIPADIEAYVDIDDYQLYHHLRGEARRGQEWAMRLTSRDSWRVGLELHGLAEEVSLEPACDLLTSESIPYIASSSFGNLSKYIRRGEKRRRGAAIFVREKSPSAYRPSRPVQLLEEVTDLFARYETQRQISRIYVPRERLEQVRGLLHAQGPSEQ